MKMKSTLWALAFACAAVSCSDDFEDPNGGNNPSANGETAQMKIVISTDAVTKAVTGEDGDVENGESDSRDEAEVKDITVFLYTDGDATVSGYQLNATSTIAAAGYSAVTDFGPDNESHLPDHGWVATVEVTIKDKATTLAGKKYGVIAVTNTGSDALSKQTFATGAALANHLQTAFKTDNGFVMSTHQLKDSKDHESTITFPAVTAADEVPSTEVFVERVAAKVRIKPATNVTDFAYEVTVNGVPETDKVTLNNAVIVNQLASGSYLLKRVTKDLTAPATEDLTDAGTKDDDIFFGDETITNATPALASNFVIDPWTRAKKTATIWANATAVWPTGEIITGTTLRYDNLYTGRTIKETYAAAESASDANLKPKQLAGNTVITADAPLTLAYTRENTLSVDDSDNGLTTAALFKATYIPKTIMVLKESDHNDVISQTRTEETAINFYTYNNDRQGNPMKFDSYNTIFAYSLSRIHDGGTDVSGYYFYKAFEGDAWKSINIKDYMASHTYAKASDPFGYLAYLKTQVDAVQNLTDDLTLEAIKDLQSFDAYIGEDGNANWTEIYKEVKPYVGGLCYYEYWIRHEDNANKNLTGVMEFGIVRNNIYELSVSGISGLGMSEVEVPDPKTPDESKDAKLNVTIYVKNWVVRKNADIIL